MTQNIPAINMIATGQKITDLRVAAGMSVRDLQDVFGFATPQAIYKLRIYGFIYYLKKDIIKRRFIEIIKLPGGLICSMTFLI